MIEHAVEQRSEGWHRLRCSIPTASQASRMITSKGELSKSIDGYAMELAANKYAGKPIDKWQGNSATERGAMLEGEARDAYSFLSGNAVREAGFFTDDSASYGASPDGIIGDNGGLEIKCQEMKGHMETLRHYAEHGKCPTEHIQQTQMEILVCGLEWVDLFMYHPDLPCLIMRQHRDFHLQMSLMTGIARTIAMRDEYSKMLMDIRNRKADV